MMGKRGIGFCICVICLAIASHVHAVEVSKAEIESKRCLNCHGQTRMARLPPAERTAMVVPSTQPSTQPTRPGIHVTPESLAGSVHASLACADCHLEATKLPHPQHMGPPTCNTANCHGKQASDYLQGAHAAARAMGNPSAPVCSTCHGTHDILKANDRKSKTHPLNIIQVCGDCHAKFNGKTPQGHDSKTWMVSYLDSVHGKAVSKGGMAVAATCADCHGPHKVLAAKDPQSTVNRALVPQTCGKCHTGISETFQTSIHGQKLAAGDKKAPVCVDCHTAHGITRTDTPEFKLDIVAECGTCHDRPDIGKKRHTPLSETYRRSYHGQVTELGFTRAARCSDCHGAHDIRQISDPMSRLSEGNKLDTCRKCHPGAEANFAKFQAHADFRDGKNFPLLHGVWLYFVIMMSCAFGFFGLHSVLWFVRSLVERIRHGAHAKHHHNGKSSIQRFNKVDRINHAFVIISFFGLTITGLPLLFADHAWAKSLAGMLGGVKSAGVMHRIFALMLIGNFVVHGVGIVRRIKKFGLFKLLLGPATMLPRLKDFQDCLGMWKWFFVGGKKPKFDRWTYWEKFDYMAEVGGSAIIGISGLMLWFPAFFSKFLPGWFFNIATVVHGYEAMLAIGFIFTIHFFNGHLRMEKFPVDDVMFTGRLPEEEFKEERAAEYERLLASGELESLRVPPPPKWYRRMAVLAGLLAMLIGTTLVVLIVLAGLGWID